MKQDRRHRLRGVVKQAERSLGITRLVGQDSRRTITKLRKPGDSKWRIIRLGGQEERTKNITRVVKQVEIAGNNKVGRTRSRRRITKLRKQEDSKRRITRSVGQNRTE